MSKFIMLTGISRGEPLIIRVDDIVSVRDTYSVKYNNYTTINTPSTTWHVKESVEEIFKMLGEK